MLNRLLIGLMAALLAFPAAAQIPGAPIVVPSGVWAAAPSPATIGRLYRASDVGAKGSLLIADGTRWRPAGDCARLKTLDTRTESIANVQTIVFQYRLPAALLKTGDILRFFGSFSKSGTTDSLSANFLLGTAGTTSDPSFLAPTALINAANVANGIFVDFRVESSSTIQKLGGGGNLGAASLGYSTTSTNAYPSAASIAPGSTADSLFFTTTIQSTGASNTVGILGAQLSLCAATN